MYLPKEVIQDFGLYRAKEDVLDEEEICMQG